MPVLGDADGTPTTKSWIYVEMPLGWNVANDGTIPTYTNSIGFQEFNSILYKDVAANAADLQYTILAADFPYDPVDWKVNMHLWKVDQPAGADATDGLVRRWYGT